MSSQSTLSSLSPQSFLSSLSPQLLLLLKMLTSQPSAALVLQSLNPAAQVVTAQDVRLRDSVVQAHAEVLTARQPVLQADVERQLLLLNDMPGVVARGVFTPGAAPGAADLVVSVAEDEPLQWRADVDNQGSRSTGVLRAGVGVQLRDVFGFGEQLSARLQAGQAGGLVSANRWRFPGTAAGCGAPATPSSRRSRRSSSTLTSPWNTSTPANICRSATMTAPRPVSCTNRRRIAVSAERVTW